jgi:transcriptional regulator with XRE-family HTH domain
MNNFMNGEVLLNERLSRNWEQSEVATKLNVSQPYLSLLETGKRPVTKTIARRAISVFKLPPSVLPFEDSAEISQTKANENTLSSNIAALNYPKFSHLKKSVKVNPAQVLITALKLDDLDSRIVEALPWLIYRFADMNWETIFLHAKMHDAQNRLGFLLSLAYHLAVNKGDTEKQKILKELISDLEKSRLVREDSFRRNSLTETEKNWLKTNRSKEARYWKVLSNLAVEHLDYKR